VTKQGGTTFNFVTDGIEAALDRARAAAGDKDVGVAGGADVVQQYLKAGLVDEMQIHVAPLLLGGGVRLFDNLGVEQVEVEATRVIDSPGVTHLKFRVVK
jgi:dihydrofolate reductase